MRDTVRPNGDYFVSSAWISKVDCE